jgi:hypothetical protein
MTETIPEITEIVLKARKILEKSQKSRKIPRDDLGHDESK